MHINLWIIFGLSCAGKRGIKSYVYNAAVEIERFFQYTYSKVSNKRTGTLINSRPKFPVVRKLFPPNMTLNPLN